jgi:hypothetical protein
VGVNIALDVAAAVLGLVVALAYGQIRQTTLWADWTTLISSKSRYVYMKACERFRMERTIVDWAFDLAGDARAKDSEMDEAVRLLGIAYDALADTAPSLVELLQGLSKLSRMVSAFAPTSATAPTAFRNLHIRRLAWWGSVLQATLLSGGERFRLQTWVLRLEARAVSRYMLESRKRLEAAPRADSPSWAEIDALVADYHTVTDETLASVRVLLVSAERR